MSHANLSIIVPIFNEEESLSQILPSLVEHSLKKHWHVVLINDGSTDRSHEIIEKFSGYKHVSIIHHRVNHGYGAALKSGFSNSYSDYAITFDADGQHNISDIELIFNVGKREQADLVVGARNHRERENILRSTGKWFIRTLASYLLSLPISDLNSGFKLYRTELVKKYLELCPNTMAFSDIITLIFVNQRHVVLEHPITVEKRVAGKSKINFWSAYDTFVNVIDIAMMFNPLRLFLPLSIIFIIVGLGWGMPIALSGGGISVGSILAIITGLIFFVIGLIASQLSAIRLQLINK